ncbi:MAG: signal peptidase I [Clostridia bacterium]|nr:signal peptidase I [Clostridia bacterium]
MTDTEKQEIALETSEAQEAAQQAEPVKKGLFGRKKAPVQYEEKTFLGIKYKKKIEPKRPWWVEALSWVLTFAVALMVAIPIRFLVFEPVRVDGHSMDDTLSDGEIMYVDKTRYASGWFSLPWQSDEAKQDAARFTVGGDPARFDVVICRYPDRGDTNFVKRVVGQPGDTLKLDQDGYLWVNGEKYDEPYVSSEYRTGYQTPYAEFTVPKKGDALTVTSGQLCVNGVAWRWRSRGEIWGLSADGQKLELKHGGLWLDGKSVDVSAVEEGKVFTLQSDYFFLMGDHRNNSNDSRAVGPVERSMIIGRVARVLLPLGKGRAVVNGLDWK